MAIGNEFRLIGICYGNPRRKFVKKDTYRTYFTLVTDGLKENTKSFVPIVAPSSLAELAHALCRNGNTVAVKGVISSYDSQNYLTGLIDVRIYFVATDIMLINKVERTELNDKTVADLIAKMPIDYDEREEK